MAYPSHIINIRKFVGDETNDMIRVGLTSAILYDD